MGEPIIVPDRAVFFIALQRTGYLTLQKRALFKLAARFMPLSLPLAHRKVYLESRLRGQRIRDAYNDEMLREYEEIERFLPSGLSQVLDIGCGVAGIDVFIHRHYGGNNAIQYYLLDYSETSPSIYYGFERQTAAYNSLAVSEDLLTQNGIPRGNIHLIEATSDNRINATIKADLIISLISWGFHYPVLTYLEQAYSMLNPGGHLIIDVRKGTDGVEGIRACFGNVRTIAGTQKKTRLLAVRE